MLLGLEAYTEAIDMWACGCIMGELLRHEPLFPTRTDIQTLEAMSRLLGAPNDHIWPVRRIQIAQVCHYHMPLGCH